MLARQEKVKRRPRRQRARGLDDVSDLILPDTMASSQLAQNHGAGAVDGAVGRGGWVHVWCLRFLLHQ